MWEQKRMLEDPYKKMDWELDLILETGVVWWWWWWRRLVTKLMTINATEETCRYLVIA